MNSSLVIWSRVAQVDGEDCLSHLIYIRSVLVNTDPLNILCKSLTSTDTQEFPTRDPSAVRIGDLSSISETNPSSENRHLGVSSCFIDAQVLYPKQSRRDVTLFASSCDSAINLLQRSNTGSHETSKSQLIGHASMSLNCPTTMPKP